jgi:copper oxidase (laccase) domain-containing protein
LVEQYAPLLAITGITHGFVRRVPGFDVRADRASALDRLRRFHLEVVASSTGKPLRLAQQVHGKQVALVGAATSELAEIADGLLTNDHSVTLGIFVADCSAVYLIDPVRRVVGLLHSGKKGTALNIVAEAIHQMQISFGSDPSTIIAQLSPCIRPPLYEVDFAAEIRRQLQGCGVGRIFDCGKNTGADLIHYYSYRMERGRTGRMLAFLALKEP